MGRSSNIQEEEEVAVNWGPCACLGTSYFTEEKGSIRYFGWLVEK